MKLRVFLWLCVDSTVSGPTCQEPGPQQAVADPVLCSTRRRERPPTTRLEATMGEFVRLEVSEGVGTIRLDRPKMNALDAQMQREIIEALHRGRRAGRRRRGRGLRRRAGLRGGGRHQGDGGDVLPRVVATPTSCRPSRGRWQRSASRPSRPSPASPSVAAARSRSRPTSASPPTTPSSASPRSCSASSPAPAARSDCPV